jgi:pentatricopeptide repeat protein
MIYSKQRLKVKTLQFQNLIFIVPGELRLAMKILRDHKSKLISIPNFKLRVSPTQGEYDTTSLMQLLDVATRAPFAQQAIPILKFCESHLQNESPHIRSLVLHNRFLIYARANSFRKCLDTLVEMVNSKYDIHYKTLSFACKHLAKGELEKLDTFYFRFMDRATELGKSAIIGLNLVIEASAKRGDMDRAFATFTDLTSNKIENLKPDLDTFRIMVEACVSHQRYDVALKLLQDMHTDYGLIPPSSLVVVLFVKNWFKNKKGAQGMAVFIGLYQKHYQDVNDRDNARIVAMYSRMFAGSKIESRAALEVLLTKRQLKWLYRMGI